MPKKSRNTKQKELIEAEARKAGKFFTADELFEIVRKKEKYHYLELGWTLEDNESINSLVEEAGARRYKKYRIFRKSL